MREIKFRGKRIKTNEWVYGDLSINEFNETCISWNYIDGYNYMQRECKEVIPETIGQYTGLKDKNNFNVYEGDIVRCDSSKKCPHEVIWTEINNDFLGSVPGWYLSGLKNPGYSFTGKEEIIGTIHDNPELLNNE